MEIWKDTVEDPKNYEVSNFGRVRNKNTGKVLKCSSKSNGYLSVTLAYGKHKDISVHRIVANAFIDNKENLKYVNHKDENKHNNNSDNLEWCTAKYNVNYGEMSKKKQTKVVQKDLSTTKIIRVWDSMKEASIELGLYYQGISACCRGVKKSCGGYSWEYYENYRIYTL